MTSLNTQLWELIENYQMPADGSGRSFVQQLINQHGIKPETAEVAIAEYRKFMYLCATREARNVPSTAVDLVWHLHMQHSRNYWDVFCKKIGKPIHHRPGGETQAHLDDYAATIEAYRSLFGTPPRGIWRETVPFNQVGQIIFSAAFILIGIVLLLTPDLHIGFGFFWLCISLTMFVQAFANATPQGNYTLTFETGDPFANRDMGECGSGDCGGCGD